MVTLDAGRREIIMRTSDEAPDSLLCSFWGVEVL